MGLSMALCRDAASDVPPTPDSARRYVEGYVEHPVLYNANPFIVRDNAKLRYSNDVLNCFRSTTDIQVGDLFQSMDDDDLCLYIVDGKFRLRWIPEWSKGYIVSSGICKTLALLGMKNIQDYFRNTPVTHCAMNRAAHFMKSAVPLLSIKTGRLEVIHRSLLPDYIVHALQL